MICLRRCVFLLRFFSIMSNTRRRRCRFFFRQRRSKRRKMHWSMFVHAYRRGEWARKIFIYNEREKLSFYEICAFLCFSFSWKPLPLFQLGFRSKVLHVVQFSPSRFQITHCFDLLVMPVFSSSKRKNDEYCCKIFTMDAELHFNIEVKSSEDEKTSFHRSLFCF